MTLNERPLQSTTDPLNAALRARLGAAHVITDTVEIAYYSQDVFWQGVPAAAVIRPQTKSDLADAVKMITSSGYAVTARGGGMSYTRGYIPAQDKTVMIDMGAMNRIVEIRDDDMYVTVEAGCTWAQLFDALKTRGLRTPYYGPMSGKVATIGGTLSQNSLFYGSGTYGTAADSVLALEVVTAEGQTIRTGSAANRAGEPFYRTYGPDLAGLFLADAGALGIKAEATLRLIEAPAATEFASFAFDSFHDMVDAQIQIARRQLAAECFGLDPYLNGARSEVKDLKTGLNTLVDVAKAGDSLAEGVKSAFAVAKAGTDFMKDVRYTLHITADAPTADHARWKIDAIKAICARGGREMEESVPRVMRAAPFQDVGQYLTGTKGERWIPIHAGVPTSRIKHVFDATMAYFESKADLLAEFNIATSHLSTVCGYDMSFEPAFYYPDNLEAFQLRHVADKDLKAYGELPHVPGATAAVQGMLQDLAELFVREGAVNRQLGKFYPYQDAIAAETYGLLQGIKQVVDPKGLINPGALGLGKETIR